MEMDLKNIIEKIKSEGVDEAQQKATVIISEAKKEAVKTIQGAEAEKETIIKKAKVDADKLKTNAEEAVRQAARDVLLGLKDSIVALFDKVTKKDVAKTLTPKVLTEMIVRLVDKFQESGKTEVEVLLSDKDKAALEETLFANLKKEIAAGVTLKASSALESGFRIGKKGESSYYDFTDEAITEAFKIFLNPRMEEILEAKK
ncbi:MAG: V-type ATP synthase subunit E [Candidatus Omnitrophica bacterium]|nr:V-type ATP synthase subunit E [Candidatus Omnitrophota bacterium]